MELKEYQQSALKQVKAYLEALDKWRAKNEKAIAVDPELAQDVPRKAWEELGLKKPYLSRKNGLGQHLPNFCLKIPTGGGKTLLAAHTIDLVNRIYRKRQTGLVLWVVPTTQIYRQTIQHLRNRDHPYRQVLDIASGGRTLLKEKTEQFTPEDVTENLVILMLMLPSAARQNKETLKVFQDSGGFGGFFPRDDDAQGHAELLKRFWNPQENRSSLDAFGEGNGLFPQQVKTSLGNTLRVLSPLIILDEGHKAYSENAQGTLRGLNPSLIVELSATPTAESNVLVDILGVELEREEMIKLDLHIVNKTSPHWKETMLEAHNKRVYLEKVADRHKANSGRKIRPICLVQVERTGKDQIASGKIHATHVVDYLVKDCGIPPEQVAVKSSEKDDIEGIDLFSPDCEIRYIITKQALQEGWDCSYAYVLAILTNPSSQNNLTQLVGRILRQPFARKTKIKDLDESYVFCFRQKARDILESVRAGFSEEGLGDLAGRVAVDVDENPNAEETIVLRDKFRKFDGKVYLPVFVMMEGKQPRPLSYENDIVGRINWARMDFAPVRNLQLNVTHEIEREIAYGLSENRKQVVKEKNADYRAASGLSVDPVFATRQLLDIIPNPWIAYEKASEVIDRLLKKWGEELVKNNFVFVVEELVKQAAAEKDRLAQEVFEQLVGEKKLRFMLLKGAEGYRLPSKKLIPKPSRWLNRKDNSQLQLSWFDQMPEDWLNGTEQTVAWYCEAQGKLLWWYRNLSRQDYRIQGWRKHFVYPDFILSQMDARDKTDYDKVLVVETKGLHLKDNDKTTYLKQLFKLCNKLAEEKSWTELGLDFPEKKFVFEVVYDDEWQRRLNKLLAADSSVSSA
jgi:type III restriction enzyme